MTIIAMEKNEDLGLKCVVVGDGGVGKTSLLLKYVNGKFLEGYMPTCFDNYNAAIDVEGRQVNLNLMDTAGQETYDRLRTLSYFDTDVFIVCFSLVDPDSLINVKTRWLPELREFKPGTPFILVGTKQDLRENENKQHIQFRKAKKISKKLHADAYVECSALMDGGIQEVFRLAAISAIGLQKQKKKTVWNGVKKIFKSKKSKK